MPPRKSTPRLGDFEGEEVIQYGCSGIDNITAALSAHLRVKPYKSQKGETVIIIARLDCNRVSFKSVKTMEDKSERDQHYRATEAFVAPEELWSELHQQANDVHDEITVAKERSKGISRLGEPLDD